jgi:hypothetical protein
MLSFSSVTGQEVACGKVDTGARVFWDFYDLSFYSGTITTS